MRMDTLYQEIGKGKYYIEYDAVKIEDAFNIVYTAAELQEKYGTKSASFDINTTWYVLSDTRIKLSEMLHDAIDAFKKDPKLKFFPAELPGNISLGYYYSDNLREYGLGYSHRNGGGFVPRDKTNFNVPNKKHLYSLKQAITFRLEVHTARTFGLQLDVKNTSERYLNNLVVFYKKLGIKKIPPLSMFPYNHDQEAGKPHEKLEGFITAWLQRDHPKYNNPKVAKVLAKQIRAWWSAAKEVR